MLTIDTTLDREAGDTASRPAWSPFGRLAFRFGFLYFGLFCVFYPQPLFAFLGPAARWLPEDWFRYWLDLSTPLVKWVGHTVFGTDLVLHDSGSGDQAILWALVFCILVIAVLGTLVWTALDRARTDYRRLAAWFLLFIRLCLAGQMLGYGFAKAIPTQMPDPALTTLLTPFGDFAPMGVLWTQVGVSPVYQSLLGTAEVLGGLLLLLPRAQLAGVLLSLVSMTQVWVLNMTFDVPVKLLSFHLMLLSLVLLIPELPRLTALLTGRAAGPAATPQPFRSRRAARIAAAAQVLLALWISTGDVWQQWDGWHQYGRGAAKSELYGIWQVTEFTRDGQPVPPLLTDESRWRRLVFDQPQMAVVQHMDDELQQVGAQIDTGTHRMVLRAMASDTDLADFTYDRPAPHRLILDGHLDGHAVTIALDQLDLGQLPLRAGRGMHLIQEDANFGKVMGE
ncbi:DoxX family protein [Nocardia yunnanensis]|uniref:DoxX family protein n=1 Tax=Nocardia yunnanensis TaxID=2382165 RepID=A0A386ZJ98_9NOCA|nr:DoxX family protein [Nocardia yunnanensis]AYF77333.1 DoxX family protein [Nocardia yunnanensis]